MVQKRHVVLTGLVMAVVVITHWNTLGILGPRAWFTISEIPGEHLFPFEIGYLKRAHVYHFLGKRSKYAILTLKIPGEVEKMVVSDATQKWQAHVKLGVIRYVGVWACSKQIFCTGTKDQGRLIMFNGYVCVYLYYCIWDPVYNLTIVTMCHVQYYCQYYRRRRRRKFQE